MSESRYRPLKASASMMQALHKAIRMFASIRLSMLPPEVSVPAGIDARRQ
jgi:hypothetical protein